MNVRGEVPNLNTGNISKEVTDKDSMKKSRGDKGGDINSISTREVIKLGSAITQGKRKLNI